MASRHLVTGDPARKLFGDCKKCGACRWYDNLGRKERGTYKPSAPDAVCAKCKTPLWDMNDRWVRVISEKNPNREVKTPLLGQIGF